MQTIEIGASRNRLREIAWAILNECDEGGYVSVSLSAECNLVAMKDQSIVFHFNNDDMEERHDLGNR
jgi:predicted transcriptional regulator